MLKSTATKSITRLSQVYNVPAATYRACLVSRRFYSPPAAGVKLDDNFSLETHTDIQAAAKAQAITVGKQILLWKMLEPT
ncbi:Nfs1p [Saccharomyces cerevisiae]|nr:Nfs1p [Saccharomyces cerevisiae]